MSDSNSSKIPSLSSAWEGASSASGRPVAVEFTFTAPHVEAKDAVRRLPLNLGLAIDRSGSMGGLKMKAAREAALGVLDGLSDGERFAAVAFDSEILDVAASTPLDDNARTRIRPSLARIDSRGSTALFGGFARAAELVALGGHPSESDSWVLVLSDGQGNQGLVDPPVMKKHAAALAERGIRTITIGIGADYQAAQLKALSDGGCGEFHHASEPGEIVEIALGELRALRETVASDLRMQVTVRGASRWLLLGGDPLDGGNDRTRTARFDRVRSGRTARVVALVWPDGSGEPSATLEASWLDAQVQTVTATVAAGSPPNHGRDAELATRAATLWHAEVLAKAMELNERGQWQEAAAVVRAAQGEFAAYVGGLAEGPSLLRTLEFVGDRVTSHWSTREHREAYSTLQKRKFSKFDLRDSAPSSMEAALGMED